LKLVFAIKYFAATQQSENITRLIIAKMRARFCWKLAMLTTFSPNSTHLLHPIIFMKRKMHKRIFPCSGKVREISNINHYSEFGRKRANMGSDCFIKRLQERRNPATCFHMASLIYVQ